MTEKHDARAKRSGRRAWPLHAVVGKGNMSKTPDLTEESTKVEQVPMWKWGRDHWGVLLYIESICVNTSSKEGWARPDHSKIQTNINRHPALEGSRLGTAMDGARYPIRLAAGETIPGPDYDEWDCSDDMEHELLIEIGGSGICPSYRMTSRGSRAAAALRAHRAAGNSNSSFRAEAAALHEGGA